VAGYQPDLSSNATGAGACTPCPVNTYKDGAGNNLCGFCSRGTWAPAGSVGCMDCTSEGVVCSGDAFAILPDYWYFGAGDAVTPPRPLTPNISTHLCVFPGACYPAPQLGGAGAMCAAGHTGVLCAACLPGYAMPGPNSCTVCPSKAAAVTALVVCGLVWAVVACAMTVVSRRDATVWSDQKGSRLLVSLLRVLMVYVQGSYLLLKLHSGLPASTQAAVGWLLYADFTALTAYLSECAAAPSPLETQLVVALTPAAVVGLPVAALLLLGALSGRSNEVKPLAAGTALTLGTILYPGVARGALQALRCVPIGDKYYLLGEPDLPCSSAEFTVVAIAAGASTAVFVVCLPVAMLMLLCRSSHELRAPLARQLLGVLYTGYRLPPHGAVRPADPACFVRSASGGSRTMPPPGLMLSPRASSASTGLPTPQQSPMRVQRVGTLVSSWGSPSGSPATARQGTAAAGMTAVANPMLGVPASPSSTPPRQRPGRWGVPPGPSPGASPVLSPSGGGWPAGTTPRHSAQRGAPIELAPFMRRLQSSLSASPLRPSALSSSPAAAAWGAAVNALEAEPRIAAPRLVGEPDDLGLAADLDAANRGQVLEALTLEAAQRRAAERWQPGPDGLMREVQHPALSLEDDHEDDEQATRSLPTGATLLQGADEGADAVPRQRADHLSPSAWLNWALAHLMAQERDPAPKDAEEQADGLQSPGPAFAPVQQQQPWLSLATTARFTYGWMAVHALRQLALILVGLLALSPVTQLQVSALVLLVFLLLQVACRPYNFAAANTLEAAALVVQVASVLLVLGLLSALAAQASVASGPTLTLAPSTLKSEAFTNFCIVMLNVGFLLLVLGSIAFVAYAVLTRRLEQRVAPVTSSDARGPLRPAAAAQHGPRPAGTPRTPGRAAAGFHDPGGAAAPVRNPLAVAGW
jgi:hypothetical protein